MSSIRSHGPRILILLLLTAGLAACAAGAGSGRPAGVSRPVAAGTPAAPGTPPPADLSGSAGETPLPGLPAASAGLGLDPSIRVGRLENGLSYYIRRNSKPEKRAELWLAVDAGSVLEDDDQAGLAHFVEHMAFNGTAHFGKQELVDYLERIGMRFGPDVNAFTGFDETVYRLIVPTDDSKTLETAFLILDDWAHAVTFDEEEVEKERGVVLEERRLGRGSDARIRDSQLPIIFKGSRYAERLPIGREEVLKTAPTDTIRRFYRDWYRPDLMAVIAVGDFDPDEIESLIRSRFAGLQMPESPRPRVSVEVPDHDETLFAIATDPEATQTAVSVYRKLDRAPVGTVGDYRRGVVERMYHAMITDRLGEIRQRPDPPFLYAFSSKGEFVRSKDVLFEGAVVKEGQIDRALDALLTEVARVERYGFGQGELDRKKEDVLRFFDRAWAERDKRDSSDVGREILDLFLENEPLPGIEAERDLIRALMPRITLEEVNAVAGSIAGGGSRVIAASAPGKEGVPAPSEEELLAVFDAVGAREIGPWTDTVRIGPLVAEKPAPGRILERRRIDELGVTEWKLSNGVRVVLKPTDFKNDQVMMSGFAPGGHSLVPDEYFLSAIYASTVLRAGGLGDFSQVELSKALTGKVATASGYVAELEQGIQGSASPQDLETMFQLAWLSFTSPRRDEDAFRSWRSRTLALIQNRLSNPGTVFQDEFGVALSRGHFRRRPLSGELIDEIDLDRALAIYRERFADAAGFTFILVGSFSPEEIEPLVLTWLGGLPSEGRSESWRDVGVETPDGVVTVDVRRGLEAKSLVRIVFSGDAVWSPDNEHDIESLAAGLRIRLREILREDMGATYGVGVSGGISAIPRQRYSFALSFGCAPESVEAMKKAVFEEIGRVKESGFDEDTLTKIREGQRRARETDLQENGFWLRELANAYRYGREPRQILDWERLVSGVTAEAMAGAARSYLDTGRYVIGTLYPEVGTSPGGS